MKDITNRLEELRTLHEKLIRQGKPEPFSNYFAIGSPMLKDEKFEANGCYIIYDKREEDIPIYMGSTTKQKRKLSHRLNNLWGARTHILAHNVIRKEILNDMTLTREELDAKFKTDRKLIRLFQEYALSNFSLKILRDDKEWKLTEIGLIFLYKPRYNNETILSIPK